MSLDTFATVVQTCGIFYLGVVTGPTVQYVTSIVKPIVLFALHTAFDRCKRSIVGNPEPIEKIPSLLETFGDPKAIEAEQKLEKALDETLEAMKHAVRESYEHSMFDSRLDDDNAEMSAEQLQEEETILKNAIDALLSLKDAAFEAALVVDELQKENVEVPHINNVLRTEKED